MNYETVKRASDIRINTGPIKIEVDFKDSSPKTLRLIDDSGRVLSVSGDYGISIVQTALPKTEKRYRLSGTIDGAEIKEQLFEHRYEADAKLNAFSGEHALKVEEIEIPAE